MRGAIRTMLAAVLAWCIGAAAAVVLGVAGVSLIGAAVTDRPSDDAISSPTAQASPTSPANDTSSPPAGDAERPIDSPAGTLLARCSAAGAYLVSLRPAAGYRAIRVDPGPAPEATVTFQSGQGQVEMVVRCLSGVPHAAIHRTTVNDDVADE
jgi:hypothetical protein